MGQFAIPIMIATAAASGGIAAKASHDAGVVAKNEAQLAARREGDAARAREIDRRRKLLQSLAAQGAAAGAAGVAPSNDIMQTDINYYQNDMLTDQANTGTTQNMLKARGINAKRAGNWAAAGSLLDAGSKSAAAFL